MEYPVKFSRRWPNESGTQRNEPNTLSLTLVNCKLAVADHGH